MSDTDPRAETNDDVLVECAHSGCDTIYWIKPDNIAGEERAHRGSIETSHRDPSEHRYRVIQEGRE